MNGNTSNGQSALVATNDNGAAFYAEDGGATNTKPIAWLWSRDGSGLAESFAIEGETSVYEPGDVLANVK